MLVITEEGETDVHRLKIGVRNIAALDTVLSAHFRVDLTKYWACVGVSSRGARSLCLVFVYGRAHGEWHRKSDWMHSLDRCTLLNE
jgi:hypothetical protein